MKFRAVALLLISFVCAAGVSHARRQGFIGGDPAPSLSMGAEPDYSLRVHAFDCVNCHVDPTRVVDGLNVVCLECHKEAPASVNMNFYAVPEMKSPTGRFKPTDASNANNSYPEGADTGNLTQTSHFWGGTSEIVPSKGASKPTKIWGSSSLGKITCGRCHEPHGNRFNNPKLIKNLATDPANIDFMCKDCHSAWDQQSNSAQLTHPMVTDYAAVAAVDTVRFKPAVDNSEALGPYGDVRLVQYESGAMGVSCTSCHGVHWTDSDSTTQDGKAQAEAGLPGYTTGLNVGDGKMLRTDGPNAPTAEGKAALCQACHTYQVHGSSTGGEQVGCLVCHSGHVYVEGQAPNYFVLRNQMTTATFGTVTDQVYNDAQIILDPDNKYLFWNDRFDGTAIGFCEKCHGSVETLPGTWHDQNAVCTGCHGHNYGFGATLSFQPNVSDCSTQSCHGWPPSTDTPGNPTGFAYVTNQDTGEVIFGYNSTTVYKDESQTPHMTHAGTGTNQYAFDCMECHTGHRHASGTFQDVFNDRDGFNNLAYGGNAPLVPSYATDPGGGCQNVYCHGNGGYRTGDTTEVFVNMNTPAWEGGNGAIQTSPERCNQCHGNSPSTMTGRNSPPHIKHLNKGFTCDVCHSATAASATSLKPGAIGGTHVNLTADVLFDSTYTLPSGTMPLATSTYNATLGQCSQVYCHSNGKGTYATPDWDNQASGACGTCHGVPPSSGSHSRHASDTFGPRLGCDRCHGAGAGGFQGAGGGQHAGHFDGQITLIDPDGPGPETICRLCHAVDGTEPEPVWGDNNSFFCYTCHTGTARSDFVVPGQYAPDQSYYLSSGHGRRAADGPYPVTGNPPAERRCGDPGNHYAPNSGCHSASSNLHWDGTIGNFNGIPAGFECRSCHDGFFSKKVEMHSNVSGQATYTLKTQPDFVKECRACHDPHGTTNIAMVHSTKVRQNAYDYLGSGPADKFAGDVVFLARTGTDSFDEADSANLDDVCTTCHATTSHQNRDAIGYHRGIIRQGQNCTNCHKHDSKYGGFMVSAGSACNQCHDNPPASGAHAEHTHVASHLTDEDRSDCARCHTGADNYTYDPSADNAAGYTHTKVPARLSTLRATVGYNDDDADNIWYCSQACHLSKGTDGYWKNAAGFADTALNCDACHYWGNPPTESGNNGYPAADPLYPDVELSKKSPLSQTHSAHFRWGKTCPDCHNNGVMPVDTSHIDNYSPFKSLYNSVVVKDVDVLTDKATPERGEPTIARPLLAFNVPAPNSCTFDNSGNQGGGLGCHDIGVPNWDDAVNSAQVCSYCHGAKDTGSHPKHFDAFVTTTYGDTGVKSTPTGYRFGCANCHPTDDLNHRNAEVNLSFDKNEGGAIKTRHGASDAASGYSQNRGVSVTCSAAYCHSDAKGTFQTTPDWYGGSFPAADYCANCHQNSPSGSTHAAHTVGIHWDAIYSGATGLAQPGGAADDLASHGNPAVSTIINCHMCHNNTLKLAYNDNNVICSACHDGVSAPQMGALVGTDVLKDFHVNGVKDVEFNKVKVKSRAQMRDDINKVSDLAATWSRVNGYKQAGSYDESKQLLNTATMWNAPTQTCTPVCHNGNPLTWSAPSDCSNCHKGFP